MINVIKSWSEILKHKEKKRVYLCIIYDIYFKQTHIRKDYYLCFVFPVLDEWHSMLQVAWMRSSSSSPFLFVVALQVYLSKQLLLKSHALFLVVRQWASVDWSLNTDRCIMDLAVQRKPHLKLLLISLQFMGVMGNSEFSFEHSQDNDTEAIVRTWRLILM